VTDEWLAEVARRRIAAAGQRERRLIHVDSRQRDELAAIAKKLRGESRYTFADEIERIVDAFDNGMPEDGKPAEGDGASG
jgi:hypothetical protein